MLKNDDQQLQKEFQLERIIFFSDAVFAIIITIMILDVKLPEVKQYFSETGAKDALLRIMPKLVGYGVSFAVVGRFWMKHLRIFSVLKHYNSQLIVINLLFLFSISLYPFGLSFFFNSANFINYKWGIYTYAIISYLAVFTQTMLMGYLIKNKEELCTHTAQIKDIFRWKLKRVDYFQLPLGIVLMAITIYFELDMRTSLWIIFSPVVLYEAVKNRLVNRLYPDHADDKVTLLSLFRQRKRILTLPLKKDVK
jgi:uncharacterized membrane protein